MSAYNTLQPSILNGLNSAMSNPWQYMAGNQQMAQGNQSIFGQSQAGFSNLAQGWQQRGLMSNSPLFATQLQQQRQATQSAQGNMYSNLLLQAQNLQTGAAQAASQYQPLQTGTTSVGSTGGLGSIL
jgi:hypothetical protein